MMQITSEIFLKEITEKIVRAVSPNKIILFGSYARGEEHAQSDLDLMIIQDTPFLPDGSRLKEMGMLWRLLADTKIPKDILLYTSEEVAKWKNSLNHIIHTALKEGLILYER